MDNFIYNIILGFFSFGIWYFIGLGPTLALLPKTHRREALLLAPLIGLCLLTLIGLIQITLLLSPLTPWINFFILNAIIASLKDIPIFGSLNSWKLGNPSVALKSASLNGAFGILQPFSPNAITKLLPIYFTIGSWTILFILLSMKSLLQNGKKSFAFLFLIASIIFSVEALFSYSKLFSVMQNSVTLLSLPDSNHRPLLLIFIGMIGLIIILKMQPRKKSCYAKIN